MKNEKRWSVLLIGRCIYSSFILSHVLERAGFFVDMISSNRFMKLSRSIRTFEQIESEQSLVPLLLQKGEKEYDWIVVTEDGVLKEIVEASLPPEIKLRFLPVLDVNNFLHLASKIGLSKAFASHGVPTPPFEVVANTREAISAASRLGYPLLLKRDHSGGGGGIIECRTEEDFTHVPEWCFTEPMLLQKKIEGIEFDLSALFLNGELVHFGYARPDKVCQNRFGPSLLRTYYSTAQCDRYLFSVLQKVGKALGMHGFCNLSCIRDEDGEYQFFEGDARPNAWVDFPRYLGEDVAERIHAWFSEKRVMHFPLLPLPGQPSQRVLPYFLRLKRWELALNRYNVWRYIPRGDPKLVTYLLLKKFKGEGIGNWSIRMIKKCVPKRYHPQLKACKIAIAKFLGESVVSMCMDRFVKRYAHRRICP